MAPRCSQRFNPSYSAPIVNGYFVVATESTSGPIISIALLDRACSLQWQRLSSYTRTVSMCKSNLLQIWTAHPSSLVFMGSEKYPYKGLIDQIANRGFSNGTNAWTDTDHTAYTVSTAGDQGFLQILPIYVDHILYPTLTKSGFVTEVCFLCMTYSPILHISV